MHKSWHWKNLHWLWLALLALVLDQGTKQWVLASFQLYERVEVTSFFNLTYVRNFGAAFSFLAGAGGWQRWFFTIIAFVISAYLIVQILRAVRQPQLCAGAALVVGGAMGNVVDRLLHGFVVDFLDVHYGGWHWPAFNIADSAICLGVALILWDAFFVAEQNKPLNGAGG